MRALLLCLAVLATMLSDARADALFDGGLDPYDVGHVTAPAPDAGVPASAGVPIVSEPPAISVSAPSASPGPTQAEVDAAMVELEKARAAGAETVAAIRTSNLPGVLVSLAILLLAMARALAMLKLAKTKRAETVFMLMGGMAAAAAYFGWADASALKETKATLLGLTGGGAVGLSVALDHLGVNDLVARLLGAKGRQDGAA